MRFKEVGKRGSKYTQCPICGKPDWCYSYETEYNGKLTEYVVCNRFVGRNSIPGFRYIGQTKNGTAKFVSDNDVTGATGYNYEKPVIKKDVERLSDKKLDGLNRTLLANLKLEDYHRKKLNEDGFTNELIELYNIRSYPPSDYDRKNEGLASINPTRSQLARALLEKNNGDLTGFPGAYIKEYKDSRYWTLAGYEGIIFNIQNVYGEVVMLQVRLDNPSPKSGKYKVFSSEAGVNEDGTARMPNGCGPSSRIGLVKPKVIKDSFVCYLTEGWKKAAIASNVFGSLFVTVQGVNSYSDLFAVNDRGERNIDVLRETYGVGMFVIMYDNDKFHNDYVLQAEKNLIDCLSGENFKVATSAWDSYMGKGIDDMLKAGYGFQGLKLNLVAG